MRARESRTRSGPRKAWTVLLVSSLLLNGWLGFQWFTKPGESHALPGVRVLSFEEAGDARRPELVLRFSERMVPNESIGQAATKKLAWIKPSVPFTATWDSPRVLIVRPAQDIAPLRDYRLHLSPTLGSADGGVLRDSPKAGYAFSTGRLAIRGDVAAHYTKDDRPACTLTFNARVAVSALKRHLSVRSEAGDELEFSIRDGGHEDGILDSAGHYRYVVTLSDKSIRNATLAVGAELPPKKGTRGLGETSKRQLEWRDALTINDTWAQRSKDIARITLYLSHPVDASLLREHVKTEPEITGLQVHVDENEVILRGDFEPETYVRVALTAGLKTAQGNKLREDIHTTVVVPAPSPELGFVGRGSILSAKADASIAIEGVRTPRVNVRVTPVYANNVVPLALGWANANELGDAPRETTIEPVGGGVSPWRQRVDLASILGPKPRGIFRIEIAKEREGWVRSARTFQITDLAVVARARPEGLVVWVRSIADGTPIEGAAIDVRSDKNQACAEGVTDEDGLLLLRNVRGDPSVVIATHHADLVTDMAFTHIGRHRAHHYAPTIEGISPRTGLHAWVYASRGVVRPGETVHAVGLVRKSDGTSAVAGLPLHATLVGPRGNIIDTRRLSTGDAGMVALDFSLSADQPTGSYQVSVGLGAKGRKIGSTSIRCACVVPDTLRPSISIDADVLHPDQNISIQAAATTLTGAPAKQRRATLRATLTPEAPVVDGEFTFGESHKELVETTLNLGSLVLDEQGKGALSFRVPTLADGGRPWQVGFELEVVDHSGRAAFSHKSFPIEQNRSRIGLHVGAGESAQSLRLSLRARDATSDLGCAGTVVVEHVMRHGHYVRQQSRWVWATTESVSEATRASFDWDGDQALVNVALPSEGRYRLHATCDGMLPASVTGSFFDGTFTSDTNRASDVILPMRWLSDRAEAGDSVELEVDAPFAGSALLTWEGRGVLDARSVALTKGVQRMKLTVPENAEKLNGVYATLTLLRGARADARGVRSRRHLGACYLPLHRPDEALETSVTVDGTPEPDAPMTIRVTTARPANVRVFVIDEGLLRLTNHAAPKPLAYLRAKEMLTTTPMDSYTRLVKEMSFSTGETEQGGDAVDIAPRLASSAEKTIETLALASEVLHCPGKARVTFTLPSYEGRVRVVAVAADALGVGSDHRDVVVRAPISIAMHVPRAVVPGDTFVVPLEVSGEGVSPDIRDHELELNGLDVVTTHPELRVRATNALDVARLSITAASSTGRSRTVSRKLAVRSPIPYQTHTRIIELNGRTEISLPGKWQTKGRRVSLRVGSESYLTLLPALDELLRYPYGCVEQTTSRAFSVLAWRDLVDATAIDGDGGENAVGSHASHQVVDAAIRRLATMQTRSGGFAMWPGGKAAYPFGSAYAVEFLSAAKAKGHRVPMHLLTRGVNYLVARLRAGDGEPYDAYAVQAAGHNVRSFLGALKRRAKTAEELAHLAGIYSTLGEREVAASLAERMEDTYAMPRASGERLTSPTRARATVALSLLRATPSDSRLPALIEALRKSAAHAKEHTTQENAAALRAVAAWTRAQSEHDSGTGTVHALGDSKSYAPGAPCSIHWKEDERVHAIVQAKGPAYAILRVDGRPGEETETPEDTKGWSIAYHVEGAEGESVVLEQGRLYTLCIEGRVSSATGNLLVNVMFPGGLEFEGVRDVSAIEGRLNAETLESPVLKSQAFEPDRVEPRDDRLLLFRTRSISGTFHHRVTVRAVTKGRFKVGRIRLEALYNPGQAATGTGDSIGWREVHVRSE